MKKQLLFSAALAVFGLKANAQTILGVDVSSYQTTINWTDVKSPGGKTFAIAKATEGIGLTDQYFVENETNGTAAGVVMGAYHFAHPDDNSAVDEANYFLSVAGPYIKAGYLPPALDLEDAPDEEALSSAFTSAELTTWVQTWMTTVENATGVKPMLYTDGNYANYLNASLNVYGLWIADPDGSTGPPNPLATYLGNWTTYLFKQYSWSGTVSGISGTADQDLNVYNGTQAQFNTLIGSNTASFTASPTIGCPGTVVTFTDHSTSTGTITGHSWTFTGGTPPNSQATNPTVTYNTAGTYNVKEVVTSTTGTDSVTMTAYIHIVPDSTLPLVQTFQSSTFPPTGWTMNYPSAGDSAWELCTDNGYNSTHCMYFPANCGYTTSIAGERQQIYTPNYSFVGTASPYMWFDVAYEPYNKTYSDTLAVYYSTDCGSAWNLIYLKGGMTLCTTGSTDSAGTDTSGGRGCFVPPNSHAWRTDSINLLALTGDASVMFSFESRSGWGNIIYIDNINVASTAIACTPPAAPVAVSPGNASGPGSSVSSVTMQWDTAAGATAYYPRIAQCPYGTPNIVWADSCHVGTSESATLAAGNLYRWNIGAFSQCGNANCESDGNTLYFNIPPVMTLTGNTSFCQGDSVALHTTAGNTVSTPEFYWYLNNTLVDSTSTGTYYAKQAGSYTAAISYSCGVTGASNAIALSVIALPATPTITPSPGLTACGSIQLTASSSGCNSCTYSWSNNTTGAVTTVTSTGTYHVTTTGSGCASSPASVAVTVNQAPTVSAGSLSGSGCVNQSVTLTATGTGTSYAWSGTGLQTSTGSSVDAIVSSSGAQTYTVTATLNSCTATASTTINFDALPATPSITPSPGLTACGSVQLIASSSGCSGCTYSWSNGATGAVISVTSTATYTVTTTSGSCASSPTSVAITVNEAPTVLASASSQQVCVGQPVTLTATGNATSYQWSGTGLQSNTGSSVDAEVSTVGSQTYTVIATLNSCTASATTSVSFNTTIVPTISISQTTTNPICVGSQVSFSASSTNGGSSPVYQWTASNSQTGSGSTFVLNNAASGITVNCLLISNASCASPDSVNSNTLTVTTQAPQPATLSISTPDTNVCSGENIVFTSSSTNGGSSPTYDWYLNSNPAGNSSTFTISNIQSNSSVYCIMTSSSDCVTGSPVTSNFMNIHIQNSAQASISVAANVNPVCAGTQVIFTATPGNGGSSPTYAWQLNGNVVGTNSAIYTNTNVQNGDAVSCSMTSSASCVSSPNVVSNTVTMQVNPLPVANAGTAFYILSSASVILGGNPSATGGTSPYNYSWSPSTGLSSTTNANPTESGIGNSTIYTLSVTDANGCTASDTVGVYLIQCTLAAPTVQLNLCDLAAQNIPAVSYQWYLQGNIIAGATTRFYTASQAGYYNVQVSDNLGCSAQSNDVFVNYPSCETSGIQTISEEPEFNIYPNPASSEITVSFISTISGSVHIEIVDLLGQTIYRSEDMSATTGLKYSINTNSMAAGAYLVRVMNAEGKFAAKSLIKM